MVKVSEKMNIDVEYSRAAILCFFDYHEQRLAKTMLCTFTTSEVTNVHLHSTQARRLKFKFA